MRSAIACALFLLACEPPLDSEPKTTTSDSDATSTTGTSATDVASDTTNGPRTLAFSAVGQQHAMHTNLTGGAGAELFAMKDGWLEHSANFGHDWERKTPLDANELRVAGGELYAMNGNVLLHSGDGGTSFDVANPFGFDGTNGRNEFMAVAPGAWWVSGSDAANNHSLARTLDGEHFDAVPVPDGTDPIQQLKLYISADGTLWLVSGGKLFTTSATGAVAWTPVLPERFVTKVWVAPSGTVFAAIYDTDFINKSMRLPAGSDTWSEPEATYFLDWYARGSDLFRIGIDSEVEVSHDDGATWEPRGAKLQVLTGVYGIVLGDEGFVAAADLGLMRLANDAEAWVIEDAGDLPYDSTARFQDIAFANDGTIAVAGERQVFISKDGGANWKRSVLFDDTSPLRCIAISPDASLVFVGSTIGRFWLLDGDAQLIGDQRNLGLSDDHIRQAAWVGNGDENILVIATASDDDTEGMLIYASGLSPDHYDFNEVNPSRVESDPTVRYTQGYHAVDLQHGWLHVAFRRWLGTSSWQPYYRINYEFFGNDSWLDGDLAQSFFYPVSLSLMRGVDGPGAAIVYSTNELYFGLQKLQPEGPLQPTKVAKFDATNHLWLVAGGLYRSNEVFTP